VEVEITDLRELTREQAALLDMHSVVNILNVLHHELDYLREAIREGERLQPALGAVEQIQRRLGDPKDLGTDLEDLMNCEDRVLGVVHEVLEADPKATDDPDVRSSVGNLRSIFAVLETRTRELAERLDAPDAWVDHDIERLTANLANALAAIEKNSKGHYRIVYNIAQQEPRDYIVNLSINSVDGATIRMPRVVQDVMRDLIANARKYTDPGGEITAGLMDNGKELRLVVEDTGRGFPTDEICEVVTFGQRGSNAADKTPMGGGFGLTKAYVATRMFGGRMWIDSQPAAGTRITIRIPRPAA